MRVLVCLALLSLVFHPAAFAAKKKADRLSKETLKEFEQHIVTQEIEKGSSGGGSSLLGGRGNFFGFLGFNKGQQPLEIIRDAFKSHIKVTNTKGRLKEVSAASFTWEFDISIPTKTEIYAVTPLEWSSRSWVKGVEKGITNATNTIFLDSERSRSGVALQSSQNII